MSKFWGVLILLIVQSCSEKKGVISDKDIVALDITVSSLPTQDTIYRKITNADSIKFVIHKLNGGKKEPIKFYATHQIKVIYKSGKEKIILCNGSSMKVDGLTYKLDESIRSIIIGY